MQLLIALLVTTIFASVRLNQIHARQTVTPDPRVPLTEEELRSFLDVYGMEAQILRNVLVESRWNIGANVGQLEYLSILNELSLQYGSLRRDMLNTLIDVNLDYYADATLVREIMMLKDLGIYNLNEEDLSQFNALRTDMEQIRNIAIICPYAKQNMCTSADELLTFYPDIENIMATSVDYQELQFTWEMWHEKTGDTMASDYESYVDLMNVTARANGYTNATAMLIAQFEDPDLVTLVDRLWEEVQPLYDELQKYVAFKLYEIYGSEYSHLSDSIPAHLLGDMSGASWRGLYDRIKGSSLQEAEQNLQSQYSVEKMFQEADEFYQSLELPSSGMSYGANAIIQKPLQRLTNCDPSAWDFFFNEDYRIKMCANLNVRDYLTIHRLMGNIVYSILYKDQPITFRQAANPVLNEVFGGIATLSVGTLEHLNKIGLLPSFNDTAEDNVNSLFLMALDKVAYLPFGVFMDKWRWEVLSGELPRAQWNGRWWELRDMYQKISPPIARTEDNLEASAIYQDYESSNFMANFLGHILQFQIHRAICKDIGLYVPDDPNRMLHKCDISGSSRAGAILRSGMELGASRHWADVLETMIGERNITSDAFLEYFQPLYNYLREENQSFRIYSFDTNYNVGAIVGGVMGAICFILLAGYTGFYFYYNSRRRRHTYNHFD